MKGKVFLSQYLLWVIILLVQLHGYKTCIQKERNALFEIKKYILSITEEGLYDLVLPTWTNDTKTDCCLWEGLKCNRTSRRIIELSIGQMYLKETSLLNLSLFHPFEDVQSLKISANEEKGFSEDAFNQFIGLFDNHEGYKSLRRLRNLKILDLSSNGLNNSIFPFLNAATSLTTLFLRDNNMDGHFPAKEEINALINLELLDLSRNLFNGSLPTQELSALRNLKALDLSYNEFSGSIELQGICNIKNIQELDLSQNKFVGQFPICLTSLTTLRVLDLSSNQLTGNIPSALGNLESLAYLSLFDNNFEGVFSLSSLTNLSNLTVLKLDSKSNSLQVEYESFWEPTFQLSVIVLRSCKLEKFPHFLLHQNNLREVDLSNNKISGEFPSWLLANNTKLQVLFLQNNSFTSFMLPESPHNLLFMDVSVNDFSQFFPENIGWILPQVRYMNLASNGFHGGLPYSHGNMKSIEFLDISHNGFSGKLPRSFVEGCYSMKILKLSDNKLSGEILLESTNFTRIQELSMENNLFTGNIGRGLRSLKDLLLLDISNNNLTGGIPSWIGELQLLNALLCSNNMLEGDIPVSLFNISNLQLLDLSTNILSGSLPPQVNSGYETVILLQDNNLSGAIPETLLANVKILDVRNNKLSGNIPEFIDTESISILLLRGNGFIGHIPRKLCTLRNIHLLYLANNRLNGPIPSCFSNTSFGLGDVDASDDYDFRLGYSFEDFEVSSYLEEEEYSTFESLLVLDEFSMDYKASTPTKIEFATKHRYDSYMGGNLEYMFGIDLSENELSGEIPQELGDIIKLRVLNLSHNNLSGVIPKSFSGMKNVESLDLSFNVLQGGIPQELTELFSLAVFKVSYNNLSGVIPQGKQFDTFDTQSYLGNLFLCGKPTNRSCNSNTSFRESDNGVEGDESTTIDMESFYWSFAAAYVTILVGIFAFLSFDSPWRRTWFYIVDGIITKGINKEAEALCKSLTWTGSTHDQEDEWPRLVTPIAHNGRVLCLRSSQVEEPASLFVAEGVCVRAAPTI